MKNVQTDVLSKKSKQDGFSLRFFLLPLAFIITSILLEALQFLWLGFGVLPKYILFNLSFLLIISGVAMIMPWNWLRLSIMTLFLTLQVVFNIGNICMFNVFGDIFSFDMIKLTHEAATAFEFKFIDFPNGIINILILITFFVVAYFLLRKSKKAVIYKASRTTRVAVMLSMLILFSSLGVGTFGISRSGLIEVSAESETYIADSDAYLYDNLYIKLDAYKKFGTWGYYTKSLNNIIFNKKIEEDKVEVLKKQLAAGEGFKNQNGMSGALAGDNVIMILMESLDWFAVNPVFTPTLYSLANKDAYSFTNFHAKNKTNMSESIATFGNFPNEKSFVSIVNNVGLSSANTLPTIFKKANTVGNVSDKVVANYFHANISSFYDRKAAYTQLGFDEVYGFNEIFPDQVVPEWGNWLSDEDFINTVIDSFIPTDVDHFFSAFASIATHGPYNENQNFEKYETFVSENFEKYVTYIENETKFVIPEDSQILNKLKIYLSRVMDLDKTVELILNNLKEKGLDQNTTLVLYSDHYAYYEDLSATMKGLKRTEFYNADLYNIPFMVYSPKLGGKQIDTFCSTYEIFPTICDLLGFDYNIEMIQGNSIFGNSIKDSVFVSFLSGAFTDKIYSNNIKDVILLDETVTEAEIDKFERNTINHYKKREFINYVYNLNLFKAVGL